MEIERGKVRTREEIMACFKDGQTIAIGGQAGAYMPWDLLDMLSFFYEPAKMSAEDVKKIEDWIETVVKELHARLPR